MVPAPPVAPRRVVHVTRPTTEGLAAYVAALVAEQVRLGWDVTVACPEEGDLAAAVRRLGAKHVIWKSERSPIRGLANEVIRLRRIVKDADPDLVHLHCAKAGLVGRLILRGKVPPLFQPHAWSFLALEGPMAHVARTWETLAARWTHSVLCCSYAEAQAGRTIGIDRVAVVGTAVDLDRFEPASPDAREFARAELVARGLLPDLDDAPLVVCLGRLADQKGQPRLLDAWPEVLAEHPGARLALVGSGVNEAALKAQAHGLDVIFPGYAREPELWWAAADVACIPSVYEGLPLTAVEASAAGIPIVATAVEGMTDIAAALDVVSPQPITILQCDPKDDQATRDQLVDGLITAIAGCRRSVRSSAAATALRLAGFDAAGLSGRVGAVADRVLSDS